MSGNSIGSWLIHVGCIKCGSTWMQRKLFPAMKDVDFVGKHYGANAWARPIWHGIVRDSPFHFDPQYARDLVVAHAAELQKPFHVLSAEKLGGHPYDGPPDTKRTADRIKEIFPGAKILMVVRRQASFCESLYKQFLLNGGMLSFENFRTSSTRHCRFDMGFLEFHHLAEYYVTLFGRENVCVLPFEMILQDHQTFADHVCNFLGCAPLTLSAEDKESVRHGYTPNFCQMVYRLNYLRKSGYNPKGWYGLPAVAESFEGRFLSPYGWARGVSAVMEKFTGPGQLFSAREKSEFAERYRESNQRLCERFPVLREFGYEAQAIS